MNRVGDCMRGGETVALLAVQEEADEQLVTACVCGGESVALLAVQEEANEQS